MKAYMARQPIYSDDGGVFGYELLYRSAQGQTIANVADGEMATKTVVSDAVMAFGLERLTNGKPAFVNFGRTLLMSDLINMLDKKHFVIEILEDTVIDDELVEYVKRKSEEGYVFAIDDYIGDTSFDQIMPYVTIVKVDFAQLNGRALRKLTAKLQSYEKILLAEKIETIEDYEISKKLGYTLFQGYYFDKPHVISTNLVNVQSSTCARVLSELSAETFSFDKLADIVKTDVSLTYRLMKHTNSLHYYRGNEINSVHLALVSMGVEEVRRWITLVFMRDLSGSGNEEKTKDSLVRAMLAEHTARQSALNPEIAFLTGMFSMIDIIVNDNFKNILQNLSIASEIKDALFGVDGPYTDILNFVYSYEIGDWDGVMPYATLHRLRIDELARVYIDAINYADSLFN